MTDQIVPVVIVNRAANKGGAGRRWPAIERTLRDRLGVFETHFTEAPGHATSLAREALARGARRFVAVGGDGTVNEALNGLLDRSGRLIAKNAVLCPIPAGTANELCRALGHHVDPRLAYDAAAGSASRPVDLLRARCIDLTGNPVERFGYLIVSVGAAATISHRTSRSRWLKKVGEVAYLLMTPIVTLGYRPRDIVMTIDDGSPTTRSTFTVLIANTENGGGGMKLMPGARFDDGTLDMVGMGEISRLEVLLNVMPKLYRGTHVFHPKVRVSQGRTFRLSSPVDTLVDLDGETLGRLPLEVSVLPRAFNVGVA